MPGIAVPDATYRSVKSFGARGNGTADDTAALNSALSAGVPLYVPPGTYLVSGSLSLPSDAALLGAAPGACVIKLAAGSSAAVSTAAYNDATAVAGSVLILSGVNRCVVANLTIDGNQANQGSAQSDPYNFAGKRGPCGIEMVLGGDHRVTNCRVTNAVFGGVFAVGSVRNVVSDCYGTGNGFGGFVFYRATTPATECESTRLVACYSEYEGCDNFRVASDRVTLLGCVGRYPPSLAAEPVGFASFFLEDAREVLLDSCLGEYSSGYGFDFSDVSVPAHYSVCVANCVSRFNAKAGFSSNVQGTTYTGCKSFDNGGPFSRLGVTVPAGGNPFGFFVNSGSDRQAFVGCTAADRRASGKTQTYGISGTFSSGVISACSLFGNATGATNITGTNTLSGNVTA